MIEEIRNGIDQHADTCTAKNMMALPLNKDNRNSAKTFNFRAIYCKPDTAWFGYYKDNRMPAFSQKKWKSVINGFFDKYHQMGEAHLRWINEVSKTGMYSAPTGRVWVFQKTPQKGYLDYSERNIRNYKVQGTASDVIKIALVQIREKIRHIPNCLLTMTVHDSIILDVGEEYVEEVANICIQTFRDIPETLIRMFNWDIGVPITGEAEFGPSWGNMKQLTI